MESDVRSTFETSDLNLASFLRCREFANDGPVPVRSFCNTLRDLKAIVR
jgi:hypothetical protein